MNDSEESQFLESSFDSDSARPIEKQVNDFSFYKIKPLYSDKKFVGKPKDSQDRQD